MNEHQHKKCAECTGEVTLSGATFCSRRCYDKTQADDAHVPNNELGLCSGCSTCLDWRFIQVFCDEECLNAYQVRQALQNSDTP